MGAGESNLEARWEGVLRAGVEAQRLVAGSIAVGGTAAAIYAKHRYSTDTDHLVKDLRATFEEVREALEASPRWRTARVQPPVLILGTIDGVQVGFRQPRRDDPIETTSFLTSAGELTIPTLDEMLGMKAYLCLARNATRDYLDFAAMTETAPVEVVLQSLLKSQARYGHLQAGSVAMDIAKRLADPQPFDLSQVKLAEYKGLAPEWHDWNKVVSICRRFGRSMAKQLVLK